MSGRLRTAASRVPEVAVSTALLLLAAVLNIGFYLPEVPAAPGGVDVPGTDKAFHAGVFALTVWALGRVLAPPAALSPSGRTRRFPIGWVVLGCLAHAVVIELVQGALLAGRSASVADVAADAVGIAVGVGLWALERRLRGPGSRPSPAAEHQSRGMTISSA
ncbi:VanZ family protein [Brachybacterium nesterenkovii]|uniref:VanZ family protein n=1 Tax=Brachybacterium nesterenkovii TaxID=47847 RepID=UPI00321A7EFE